MRIRLLTAVVPVLIAMLSGLLIWPATATPAGAVNPPPPITLETPGIDAHPGYKPQKSCTASAKPGTTALLKALLKTWGGKSWGISRFCTSGGTSEHKEGRALDWHMDSRKAKDRKKVDQAISWITRNRGEVAYRLGIMYVIWNQKIWSTYYQELGWRKMANRGSWTANHKDHVHISLTWDGAMGQTSWWTGKVLQVPKNGRCGTASFGPCQPMIGRSKSNSWPAVTVGPFSPYPSETPNIAGSPRVGLTLRAVPGTWTPSGATLAYQWLRDGKAIAGATAAEYVVAAADIGRAIRLRVSATAGGATTTKTSDSLPDAVPGILPAPRPKVTGEHLFGSTLSGAPEAAFPEGTTVSYQWQRNEKDIAKATASDYTLAAADVGKKVRLRVRAALAGYTTITGYSSAVTVKPQQFSAAPKPTVDGILRVGGRLTAVPGEWSPQATFGYQWYRNGKKIKGKTKVTYTLGKADLGKRISVRVRGTLPGYAALNRDSERSAAVQTGLSAPTPKLSDATPRVGQLITANPGTWKPAGATFGYQWYRNGKAIAGATERGYTVTAADHGTKLRVQVTGSLDGYPNLSKKSASSSKVANGQFKPGTVEVTGEPAVDSTLTADEGTWTSKDSAALTLQPVFRYQWYAAGKAVKGATARTFTPASTHRGKKVHVVVTGTLPRYTKLAATSAAVTIG